MIKFLPTLFVFCSFTLQGCEKIKSCFVSETKAPASVGSSRPLLNSISYINLSSSSTEGYEQINIDGDLSKSTLRMVRMNGRAWSSSEGFVSERQSCPSEIQNCFFSSDRFMPIIVGNKIRVGYTTFGDFGYTLKKSPPEPSGCAEYEIHSLGSSNTKYQAYTLCPFTGISSIIAMDSSGNPKEIYSLSSYRGLFSGVD